MDHFYGFTEFFCSTVGDYNVSGNLDIITGDFSGVVKGGFYVKNGSIEFPVTGVMIAGNSYAAIKNITEISKNSKEIITTSTPDILIDNISITAS